LFILKKSPLFIPYLAGNDYLGFDFFRLAQGSKCRYRWEI